MNRKDIPTKKDDLNAINTQKITPSHEDNNDDDDTYSTEVIITESH